MYPHSFGARLADPISPFLSIGMSSSRQKPNVKILKGGGELGRCFFSTCQRFNNPRDDVTFSISYSTGWTCKAEFPPRRILLIWSWCKHAPGTQPHPSSPTHKSRTGANLRNYPNTMCTLAFSKGYGQPGMSICKTIPSRLASCLLWCTRLSTSGEPFLGLSLIGYRTSTSIRFKM